MTIIRIDTTVVFSGPQNEVLNQKTPVGWATGTAARNQSES